MVAGASAGGGLAAGIALLARDRKGPALAGQVLIYPMLDDRDATISTAQIDGEGIWDRGSNIMGWNSLLGERKGTDEVSIYAAPARATDLSGLPPAYIDCGSAVVFRDGDVAYATLLWQSETFRRMWAEHRVREHRTEVKRLHHASVEDIELTYEGMELQTDRDLVLTAYTAQPGTASADKLSLLSTMCADIDPLVAFETK